MPAGMGGFISYRIRRKTNISQFASANDITSSVREIFHLFSVSSNPSIKTADPSFPYPIDKIPMPPQGCRDFALDQRDSKGAVLENVPGARFPRDPARPQAGNPVGRTKKATDLIRIALLS